MDFEDTRGRSRIPCRGSRVPGSQCRTAQARRGGRLSPRPGRARRDGARQGSFQRRKADAGFVGIHWPKEWGGRGGTQIQNVIYNQEEAKFDVLTGIFGIGIHLAMPTICVCGTPEQRDRFVPPAMRADEVWCQLFSRTVGRIRSGRTAHARRTRRRRLGHQRPEDLEFRSALQRLRHTRRAQRCQCAEARRPDVLHPGHEIAGC